MRGVRLGVFAVLGIAAAWLGMPVWRWLFQPVNGCLRADAWPGELIALHVVGDGLTFIPYVGIPVVLVVMIWMKLKARPAAELLPLFGAFIVLCGFVHLDDIITIWWPAYWFTGIVKLATGLVSTATLIKLIQLVPAILGLGNQRADLEAALAENEHLRKEAEARAIRAEGEVTELEAMQAQLKAALSKTEAEKARAERATREAIESARIAEAARRQAEAAQEEKHTAMRAVRDLSTPVLPLTEDIVVMPLIGALDSMRAAQAMEVSTEYVSRNGARFLILDLSGVPVVDTQVASAILKTIQAVSLIGGKCIVTGIQPPVAQTIVDLGIDMAAVTTRSTLRAGLTAAMAMVKAA